MVLYLPVGFVCFVNNVPEFPKEIFEHVYLAGIIEERKESKPAISLDELLKEEELSRADLEG